MIKGINIGWLIAAGLLAGGVMLGGCRQPTAGDGPPRGGPAEVAVVTVAPKRLVVTTELSGRTSASRVAEVRPQVGGIIQKRLFREGADVRAGEPLYQIDSATYQAAQESAAANLVVVQKGAERARAVLEANLAGVVRQRATLALARKNRDRFEEAFRERAVSASQRDQAATESDIAEAALRAVEAQVESDRKAVAAAEAAILQAEAALKAARISIGHTAITAPISGRIGKSSVTEGALVNAFQPAALAVIQQLDPMYVDVPQSTVELHRLRRRLEQGGLDGGGKGGNRVRLVIGEAAYPWDGELQFRDVTVDPTTGSVILRVVFPNPQGLLMPGMFVRAVVEEGINPKAILIPQQAVSRNPKGEPVALVVDRDGKVQQRMLTLERAIGHEWLVSSGLAAGERLVVEGMQKVRPGAPVNAVPFEAGPEKRGGGRIETAPPAGKKN